VPAQGARATLRLDPADDLRRFLAGEPVQALPVDPWERAVRWARGDPGGGGLVDGGGDGFDRWALG
jgi:hypothetical protein